MLTATLDPGDEQAFRRMGINRWLLKPAQAGKLASVVADLLPFTRKEQEETPMPASEPAEQPADVFDPAAALDTLGGEALLKRLAGIFLGEEPNIRANLQRFALPPETLPELCPELRRQAHSLKNGAGMLHLESLRKASSDLEQAAASRPDRTLPPCCAPPSKRWNGLPPLFVNTAGRKYGPYPCCR